MEKEYDFTKPLEKLTEEEAAQEIEKLIDLINYHDWRYYVLSDPEIPDEVYDSLMRRLRALEERFPHLRKPYSPTQRLPNLISTEFPEVSHPTPLLSLDNAFSLEEVKAFLERVYKNLGTKEITFVLELKFDGVALSLLYENGVLIRGATRGNGFVGEDVTPNVKTIKTIPLKLRGNYPKRVHVKGEVLMFKEDFQRLNQERQRRGEPPFVNTRNAASGSLRQQDPRITAQRNLKFFAYDLDVLEGEEPKLHEEALELLREWGFIASPHWRKAQEMEEIEEYINYWTEKREELPFDADGIVIKVNERWAREKLGATARAPRWAIAYKFPSKKAVTRLLDVKFNVGRTGVITPVAQLEPVQLEGATIKSATLHNFEYIKKLDVRIGDVVIIQRAGKVIPEVIGVMKELRPPDAKEIKPPEKCPSCSSELVWDGVFLKCPNPRCPEKIKAKLKHYVSRNAMDIEVLGEKLIDKLVDLKLVKDIPDLYTLTVADLTSLERMGKKLASKIISQIEESRSRPLHRVIFALGIPRVGEQTAKALSERFSSLRELMNAKYEDLVAIKDIGPETAEEILKFFADEENRKLVEKLMSLGIGVSREGKKVKPSMGPLFRKRN